MRATCHSHVITLSFNIASKHHCYSTSGLAYQTKLVHSSLSRSPSETLLQLMSNVKLIELQNLRKGIIWDSLTSSNHSLIIFVGNPYSIILRFQPRINQAFFLFFHKLFEKFMRSTLNMEAKGSSKKFVSPTRLKDVTSQRNTT
jgi:hypothetical protein